MITVWYEVYRISGDKEFKVEELEFTTKAEAEEHFQNTFGVPTEVVKFRNEWKNQNGNKLIGTKMFFTKAGINWIVKVKRISDT
jgi:hypothetical protein